MAVLGKGIFEKITLQRREMEIPEWGGTVLMQELTPQQVEEIQSVAREAVDTKRREAKRGKAMIAFQLLVINKSWINPDGSRVLQDDDTDTLRNQSFAVLSRMAGAISELSGVTEGAPVLAQKNLESSQSYDSGTF